MVRILTTKNREEWNQVLKKLPDTQLDVYYTPEYYLSYEKYGDGKAQCFVFENSDGIALYPFFLNNINKLSICEFQENYYDIQGVYGYNGIIASNLEQSFVTQFYTAFQDYCRDNKIIAEFTRFHPLLHNENFSKNHMSVLLNRETIIKDLNPVDGELEAQYSSMCKRAIKKAVKNQVTIKTITENFRIEDFKKLYAESMDRVGADQYLFFNDEYFENLFKIKNVVQFCAVFEQQIIASTVCFYSTDYFHYHLGASASKYLHLRPNNLLFHEMIKFGQKQNCLYIHFGGGNSKSPEDTLLKFKSNFSNDRGMFFIGMKIHNEKIYKKLCDNWGKKYPDLKEKYKDVILKYRLN